MGCRASHFLWPLLFQSQDCMAAALACSKILKELAKEEDDTDTTDDMLALAEQYEQKAIGEREGTSDPQLLPCPAGLAGFAQEASGGNGWCQTGGPLLAVGGAAVAVPGWWRECRGVSLPGAMSRSCCKG